MSLLALLSSMTTRASGLHPLKTALPDGELHLTLRNAVRLNEEIVVECDYRPRRERDVRKERALHLFDFLPWRIGSRDVLSVHREEANRVTRTARAVDTTVIVTVPLHHPDPAYPGYQLARVRVDNVEFERWFDEIPSLDPGFGLICSATTLSGVVRSGGLGASPLGGKLPLWPGLREVDLAIASVAAPVVRLWDSHTKHGWDGWRQSVREPWQGGETIIARHIEARTIWRTHEYYAFQPADAPAVTRPAPPAGVLPGIAIEVYWPEGDTLEFPDVHFERPATVTPLRFARLTPRAREILARSVETRPGVELKSLSAEEWEELGSLADETAQAPAEFAMRQSPDGKDVMTVRRRGLTEPWLYLFGVEYDSGRRFGINVMLLIPAAWSGPMPE